MGCTFRTYCDVASAYELFISQCVVITANLCGLALLWFDYALTFTVEVERTWKHEFTGATVAYLVLRYASLFRHIWVVIHPLWIPSDKVRTLMTVV